MKTREKRLAKAIYEVQERFYIAQVARDLASKHRQSKQTKVVNIRKIR